MQVKGASRKLASNNHNGKKQAAVSVIKDTSVSNLDPEARHGSWVYEVDAMRGVVMVLAVFVHGAGVFARGELARTANMDRHLFFDWLGTALYTFVASPTFMVVGGFFALWFLDRQGIKTYLLKRTIRLAVPLITISLTFGLFEMVLRYQAAGQNPNLGLLDYLASDQFRVDLYEGKWLLQLWFLWVLLVWIWLLVPLRALAAIGSAYFLPLLKPLDHALRATGQGLMFPVFLALVLGVLQWALSTVPGALFSGYYDRPHIGPVGLVSYYKHVYYGVNFFLGVAFFDYRPFYLAATRLTPVLMVLGFCALVSDYFIGAALLNPDDWVSNNLGFLLKTVNRWIAVLAFMALMRHLFSHRPTHITRVMTRYALSVYLIHHALIFFFGTLFMSLDGPLMFEFLAICLLSLSGAMLIHRVFIQPFKLTRLLFNGALK